MMHVQRHELLTLDNPDSIVWFRQKVREWAVAMGFGIVDQTKLVTAASELARNTIDHAGGGTARIEAVRNGRRQGLRLVFEDQGPGIYDVEQALQDGYSTVGGLGMGLGGSKRLVNEFDIDSRPGEGTRVTIIKWK